MNAVHREKQVARLEADMAQIDAGIAADKNENVEPLQETLNYRSALSDELAALNAVPADKPKERVGAEAGEYADLVGGLQFRSYMNSIVMDSQLDGREAEFNQERKLRPGFVPLEALVSRDFQYRADTTLTQGDYQVNVAPIVQQVFKSSDLVAMNANLFSAPVGQSNIPVITGSAVAVAKAKAADTTPVDASPVVRKMNPSRHTIALQYALEEEYEFSGLEAALRGYATGRLSEQLDNAVINTATTGILAELTAAATTTTEVAYGDLSEDVLGMVDGLAAGSEGDVRALLGAASYRKIGRPTSAGLRELQELRAMSVGIKASAHIPAPSTDNQTGIFTAFGPDLNVAIWNAVRFVKTDVAGTGRIRLDAHMFIDFAFSRETYWKLESYHLA